MVDPATLHHCVKIVEPDGEWIDDGSEKVIGSRYRLDYQYGRKTNEINFEVTGFPAPTRFAMNTISGSYPITADYMFTALENRQSKHVEFEMLATSESKFAVVMFVLGAWFAKRFMTKQLDKEFVDLQAFMKSSMGS